MKFLNLDTGYSFDGVWNENQEKGYIFWFPNEQSTNITYTMPICILTETDTPLNIIIEDNEIFSFISHNENYTYIDGYNFNEPIYSNSVTTLPEQIGKYYAHIFNVSCMSKNVGEYICKITINDNDSNYYIRVGADIYGEQESLYINLSNMGVELPASIQKAIYDTNVHEDNIDNILINRKLKELLSNYWDIIANKGSYKSLLNSLQWFEWDNILKVREIWKKNIADNTFFSDKEILSIFTDKIEDTMNNFLKTTYLSLYCSLQKETSNYDIEYNPEIENAVLKWSKNDIHLKIALLAKFFGIYFMPMHMSILHATAEDIVFTNTIKSICGSELKHDDCFGDFNYVECNIKDDTSYKMSNIRAQSTDKTIYGIDRDNKQFAVDIFPTSTKITENNIEIFSQYYYTGPGVIIPIECVIPNQSSNDFIKQTVIDCIIDNENTKYVFYDTFKVIKNRITIKFNYLAKRASKYEFKIMFILASGNTITRNIKFNVEDADNLNINVYKICSKDDINGFTEIDFTDTSCSKYIFKLQNNKHNDKPYYTQYLPYMLPSNENYKNYKGIKLNRTIIIDCKDVNENEIENRINIINDKYLVFTKYKENKLSYLILVSKKFYEDTPSKLYDNDYNYNYNVIRNELVFYPQFHYLKKMDGNSIENYTISQYDAICCAAEINNGKKIEDFKYGNLINTSEWTFYNHLTNEEIKYPISSQQPFIANEINSALKCGYYNISFKYSLTNEVINECKLNSAFRVI